MKEKEEESEMGGERENSSRATEIISVAREERRKIAEDREMERERECVKKKKKRGNLPLFLTRARMRGEEKERKKRGWEREEGEEMESGGREERGREKRRRECGEREGRNFLPPLLATEFPPLLVRRNGGRDEENEGEISPSPYARMRACGREGNERKRWRREKKE